MKQLENVAAGILGFLLFIVAIESVVPRSYVPEEEDIAPMEECIGTAIVEDFPYNGGIADPWSCEEQCSDNKPRFVLYSNGTATQCEEPPGCNDYGEDFGITCIPPAAEGA